MGIFRGSTPQVLQDLGVAGVTYQITVTLTPEQLRSLNTSPVDIVVVPNVNTFLAPMECVFVGSQGSVAYSASPSPALDYTGNPLSSVSLDPSGVWDGSAPAASFTETILDAMGADNPEDLIDDGLIGLSLRIVGTDVTGGDAPCTIILTYVSYDLTGLL